MLFHGLYVNIISVSYFGNDFIKLFIKATIERNQCPLAFAHSCLLWRHSGFVGKKIKFYYHVRQMIKLFSQFCQHRFPTECIMISHQ